MGGTACEKVEGIPGPLMDRRAISGILPHSGDALLVDEVLSVNVEEKMIVARFTPSEFHCRGHFSPDNFIFPGHRWPEALAQAGGLLLYYMHREKALGKRTPLLVGLGEANFHHFLSPHDVATLTVTHVADKGMRHTFRGVVTLDDKVMVTVENIMFVLMPNRFMVKSSPKDTAKGAESMKKDHYAEVSWNDRDGERIVVICNNDAEVEIAKKRARNMGAMPRVSVSGSNRTGGEPKSLMPCEA